MLHVTLLALAIAHVGAGQVQAPGAKAQADVPPSQDHTEVSSPPAEVPRFHAESRQVIVEAEVWNKAYKKSTTDRSLAQNDSLRPAEKDALRRLPPPAPGLTAKDFHVFDNGAERSLNYFKEADFPAVDTTNQWRFVPTAHGTWATLLTDLALEVPSATYLIGYVPPGIRPGECRTIKVVAQDHDVQLNRDRYCALNSSDSLENDPLEGTKLGTRMRSFANSSAHGSIKVSMQAFAFWSSGVLSLGTEGSPTGNAPVLPMADYKYVVEVHDSKAPATVQIATEFDLPTNRWDFPCANDHPALHVLGIAYKTNGDVAGQFFGTSPCPTLPTFLAEPLKPYLLGWFPIPTRFDTQIELPPGDYDLRVVVTDGKNFGQVRVPLRVQRFDAQRLMISDVVVGGVVRDASWVLREVASVSPSPVVPTPLVSKNVQFFPDSDTPPRLRKHSPLFLYFEIYEPLLETQKTAVYYRARITDLKTGSLVMNTEPISAANWVSPGNVVVSIGLKLATEKLSKGSYKLEVQASDSAGRESEWRAAKFNIQ